jgi:hypothetical protein
MTRKIEAVKINPMCFSTFGGLRWWDLAGLAYRTASHFPTYLTVSGAFKKFVAYLICSGVPCTVSRRTYEHMYGMQKEVDDATLQPQIEATILEHDNQDCEATPNAGTRLLASVVCC